MVGCGVGLVESGVGAVGNAAGCSPLSGGTKVGIGIRLVEARVDTELGITAIATAPMT